jgi:uncharacterized protein
MGAGARDVKKPAKAKRRTASRPSQADACAPAKAKRASTPKAKRAGGSKTRSVEPVIAIAPLPALPQAPAFSSDERTSIMLLLVPVLLLITALGVGEKLSPHRLLLQPIPLASSDALASDEPIRAVAVNPPAPLQLAALSETPSSVAPPNLDAAPPAMTLKARPATDNVGRCVAPAAPQPAQSVAYSATAPVGAADFGLRLAKAARAQTEDLVVYIDRYRTIGFPMGDVPSLYGVCTDVVIRAYRSLGVDLQVLVHNAHLGTGDPSIDHRRTNTLRRFFEKNGVTIPVTEFVDDFRPGDIVTYHRPDGRGSQSHIAVVSDLIAPSGRPMIVHNRGWGPQLEDALFANEMTGHYRFTGGVTSQEAALQPPGALTLAHAAH